MRRRDELIKYWKIPVPAVIAGKVEMVLMDPLTREPKYGARTQLVTALLETWLDSVAGKAADECKPMPSLEELRAL